MTPGRRRLVYTGRKTVLLLAAVAVAGALVAADRWGLLGRARVGDLEAYDGRVARVTHVVDGDTLDVNLPDATNDRPTTRIRLWGVDTPETVKPNTPPQHFGPQATEFVRSAALGTEVRLELEPRDTRDKYGRLLAYVHLADGRMLNRVLVEQGYGYADPRFPHRYKREFARLMKQAKTAGRGLWKDVRPGDLPAYLRERLPD